MSYRSGKICTFYENGLGCCFLNGSGCMYPFGSEGCKHQCDEIFKNIEWSELFNHYKPTDEPDKEYTKDEIFKRLGIKKGDLIGDWFIPYRDIDMLQVPAHVIIKEGFNTVREKFAEYKDRPFIRIFQNASIIDQPSIYIIGLIRAEED